jgi:hypothetical protein
MIQASGKHTGQSETKKKENIDIKRRWPDDLGEVGNMLGRAGKKRKRRYKETVVQRSR